MAAVQKHVLRVHVARGTALKLTLLERPKSVEELKEIMQERFKPRLDGDFSLHYEDPDFDGELCLLVDIQELPEKGTLRVIRPEGDTSSTASSDTDILPHVPAIHRQKSWPDHFVVPNSGDGPDLTETPVALLTFVTDDTTDAALFSPESIFLVVEDEILVAAQQGNAENIKTSADCLFTFGQSYSVRCEQEGLKIQPAHADFCSDFGPDFHPTFEVFLMTNPDLVTLVVQDQEKTEVWKRNVHLKDPRSDTEQRVQPQDCVFSVWTRLIQGLSDVTVNQLLDRLYDQRVLSQEEKDVIRAQIGADKARQLIDRVHRKGPDAVSLLKTALREVDSFLYRTLNLT